MEKSNVKWTPTNILGVVIMLGILVIFLQSCFNSFSDKSSEAFVISQDFVKDRLESPSADFCYKHDDYSKVTELDNNEWEVKSCVDIENEFGTTERTFYTVVIKYDGNEKWELLEAHFK